MLELLRCVPPGSGTIVPFLFGDGGNVTPPTQSGAESSVRLLLTKKPALLLQFPLTRGQIYRLNGFRGPGRDNGALKTYFRLSNEKTSLVGKYQFLD